MAGLFVTSLVEIRGIEPLDLVNAIPVGINEDAGLQRDPP
jgi:hypothetical protein